MSKACQHKRRRYIAGGWNADDCDVEWCRDCGAIRTRRADFTVWRRWTRPKKRLRAGKGTG